MDWEKYRKWYKIEGCCGMQCHLDTVHGSPGSIVKRRMIWERTQWQWEDSLSFYDGVIFLTARLTILWMWTANRTKSLRRTWDAQTGRILRMVMKLGKWMARMVLIDFHLYLVLGGLLTLPVLISTILWPVTAIQGDHLHIYYFKK